MLKVNCVSRARSILLLGQFALLFAFFGSSVLLAADATVLDTDPNADGLGFGKTDAFTFGAVYTQNVSATLNGNNVLSQTQNGVDFSGAGISLPVSNGENGITESLDGIDNSVVNPDINNPTAPNSVFTTIGNPGGKLANGNVLRFSMWVRVDAQNPITVAPQIEPVLKFEFWKEALSTFADTGGGQPQPYFGDKIIDTDQHLASGIWIDLDNNGSVIDAGAAGTGRIRTISSTEWRLIEVTHTVNDSQWIGIDDDAYTVADVEEVRAVMFWGDFALTNLANAGTLLFDNLLFEVFRNSAAVTPNTNPLPLEPGDFNGDTRFDCMDIDALVAAVVGGSQQRQFDLDGNGTVDAADVSTWRAIAGNVNLPSQAAYLPGDANLDGLVDGSDFGIWNANKFTTQAAWCKGDFSVNGSIDGSDFGIWNANKFTSADGSMVPEPVAVTYLLACLAAFVSRPAKSKFASR